MTASPRPTTSPVARRRWVAAGLLATAIALGLAGHAWLPAGTASDITGDVLYAVAAYLGVVLIAPRLPPLVVGTIALAWCLAVELFQLTGLPLRWGAAFPPVMLLLGTVFDGRDLLVYALAVAGAFVVDAIVAAARRRGPSAKLMGE